MIKRQTENYQREQADKAVQKALMQQGYSKDLEAQINVKRQNQILDQRLKEDERNMMLRNQEVIRTIDTTIHDSYN